MNEFMRDNIEYIHFQNLDLIDKFINYINEINIEFSHKCCNGKGVGIILENISRDTIIQNFKDKLTSQVEVKLITVDTDICGVCREPTNKALNCLTPHHICEICVVHIKNECPYCRRNISNLNLDIV
jgi:hypothetical protein